MPSARRTKWAKIRISATVFTALLILGVLLALLTGGTLLEPKVTLHVHVPDATGLGDGTPVRLNGIPIGKITAVRFTGSRDPNRVVQLDVQVEGRYLNQIAIDSMASTTTEDIQGDKLLDITRGRSLQAVRPGGEIPFQSSPEVLKAIDLAQFTQRLKAIDDLLADIQAGKGAVGQLVRGDALYRATLGRVDELEKAVRLATSKQTALGRALYTDAGYRNLLEPIRRLDEGLARMQRGEGAFGQFLRDERQYNELQTRIATMRRDLAGWNAGEGSVGTFLKSDTLYARLTRRVAGLIAAVDSFNAGEGAAGRLLMSAQIYESLNGALRELGTNLKDFREHPSRYLRLEVF